MPCTYTLYSLKLNKYYVGACTNLSRRYVEHNSGKSTFTSVGMPWEIKFVREFSTLAEAKVFEKKVKRMKSRKYIEHLIISQLD
jgi:putative endonuclease